MNLISKYQTVLILLAVTLGLLFGQINYLQQSSAFFIIPFLMIMLFGLFLNVDIKSILNSFLNIKFLSANLIINFIWTPIFAYILGSLFLQNHLALAIGLMMLLVTPCTDWYLIFTGIAKGNVTLSLSILPLNLILQVLLLPIFLFLSFGKSGSIDFLLIWESVFLVLVLPFAMAQIIRLLLFWKKERKNFGTKTLSFFEKSQIIFLSLAIFAMFCSQGAHLIKNIYITLLLLIPLSIFFVVNYFVGTYASNLLKFSYEDSVSLKFTVLARNSPIALAIAVTAFPFEPLIALALVIGPLIELPILGLISQIILRTRTFKQ